LTGLLFANLAMTKLEYFHDRRPLAVRGLSTLWWTAFLLFLLGNLFGQPGNNWYTSATEARGFAETLLGICFGLLLFALPIFATRGKLAYFHMDAVALILLSGVVIAAFIALGNFLSVAFRDRKAAMVLTYLTIAALSLLPFFGFMTWEASGRSASPQISWQFL